MEQTPSLFNLPFSLYQETDRSDSQPTKSTENEIDRVSTEILEKIFSYLPWEKSLQTVRQVNKSWKSVIDDPGFLSAYFPKFKTSFFPSDFHLDRIIDVANRYGDGQVESINLDGVFLLEDQQLAALRPYTRKLSLSGSNHLTVQGFINFLRGGHLVSPASLNLEYSPLSAGLENHILQEMINQKMKFQSLNLSQFNSYSISSKKFFEFTESGCLDSPCRLILKGCSWVNGEIIEALIKAQVKLNALNLSGCQHVTKSDIVRLIEAGCLVSPCELNLEQTPTGPQDLILKALLEKKIQLKAAHFSDCQDITKAGFIDFIKQGGLASPCSIHLNKSFASNKLLKALADQKVEIEEIEFDCEEGISIKAGFDYLINFGKWSKPCKISLRGAG